MDYNQIFTRIYNEIRQYSKEGKQADYIPALAKVNPDQFGICLQTAEGSIYPFMDADVTFSIQSISKVLSLAMALSIKGESMWSRVGKEPSGTAFNSIIQLELENGIPRNPFINAGAIVVADMLLGELRNPEEEYIEFIRALADDDSIDYNMEVANSEKETGFLNAAMAYLLKSYGNICNPIDDVLMFYFKMCSVQMSCRQLSKAFLPFSQHNKQFDFNGIRLTTSQIKRMNALMQTCGFYDEAGEFSYLIGLPRKSGVGGGIVAVCPMRYSVAVWSPRLNPKGNSVMGMKALELLTTYTEESIF